jgi:hypothetical protein
MYISPASIIGRREIDKSLRSREADKKMTDQYEVLRLRVKRDQERLRLWQGHGS